MNGLEHRIDRLERSPRARGTRIVAGRLEPDGMVTVFGDGATGDRLVTRAEWDNLASRPQADVAAFILEEVIDTCERIFARLEGSGVTTDQAGFYVAPADATADTRRMCELLNLARERQQAAEGAVT